MWDGRLANLEEQALGPIQSPGEMNMPIDKLMDRLKSIPEYKPLFAAAFPGEEMSPKTLAKAIATYERTVVSSAPPSTTGSTETKKPFPKKPSAALSFSIPRPSARHVTRGGISPTTASRTSACRATTSGA